VDVGSGVGLGVAVGLGSGVDSALGLAWLLQAAMTTATESRPAGRRKRRGR
jgi:hypothetical protein